jgi:tetratricopeptide (TPR) repeat protein
LLVILNRRSLAMKKMPIALLILGLVATPVWAQSKLDKAIKKAYEKLEDGKPDEAVKELTKATKEGGAPAHVALGDLYVRLGNLDEAAASYKQATQVATPAYKPEVLALLANFTLRRGTAQEALLLANMAVEASETADTLAARARAQVRSQDGPGALETADKAVALDASSWMAQVARGEALFSLGRNADAEVALRKAVQLAPDSALAHSRLARVLIALGRPTEAIAAGRKATEVDDTFGEGFAILGGAILAENLDNWGDAIAQAQQGAFLDPKNPIVQTIVGRIFEANGQGDQAVSAFRRAVRADPSFAGARLALIKAELNRGNRDTAIELAKKAAADMPSSPEIQYLLGVEAARQDDYMAALGFLERAIKGMPGSADAWALLGRAYQFNKRPDDAAEAYGKAVELAPQNFNYRTTYGLLLGITGNHEGGLEQLKRVVETPGYKEADAWVNLGWVYRNMNMPEESIAAYRKALEIDPKQEQASLGLGWAYQQTKAYDQAIAAYQQAVQTNPEVAGNAYTGVSWCYFFKQDVAKAKDFQAKATQAGGTDSRLGEWIAKLEQGLIKSQEEIEAMNAERQKEYERQQKLVAAANAVRSRNPARRAQGARDLGRYGGKEFVDELIYLMQADDSYDVRIAATNALGSLGRAARKAIPNIEGLLAQPPYDPGLVATEEQLEMQMKDGDYRKAMRNALSRIRG